MGNYQQRVKSFDFVLKVIKDTSLYKRSPGPSEARLTPLQTPPKGSFSSLSNIEKGVIRKKCSDYLTQQRSGFFTHVFCGASELSAQAPLHETLFDLLAVINSRCLDEPGVFRKEGERETYARLVERMVGNEPIDFSKYSVLVLGSVLKSYIRDHLDGFFEPGHLEVIVRQLKVGGDVEKLCRCLVFSLSPQKRRFFEALREVFEKIVRHQGQTRMSYESLCNIFCLTMTPQTVFKHVWIVPLLASIFRLLLRCDIENVSEFKE